jgi:enoyl-CoA hydratase/carnithine racemase
MEPIKLHQEQSVARVILNRPEKHNALTLPMFETLLALQNRLLKQEGLTAIIIEGTGNSFCSGLDILSVMKEPNQVKTLLSPIDETRGTLVQAIAAGWQHMPVPVIAALKGYVYGAGFQIAMGAHMRIAHPETRFGIKEIQWGLIPDMGISLTLPELAPKDKIIEWVLTGNDISFAEAQQYHLVTQTSDTPEQAALDLAEVISNQSPDAIRAAIYLLNRQHYHTPNEQLTTEAYLQQQLIGHPNQLEAVQAKVSKKAPHYQAASIQLKTD